MAKYFIEYTINLGAGPQQRTVGPYDTIAEAQSHLDDIAGYEGYQNGPERDRAQTSHGSFTGELMKPWRDIVKRTVKHTEHSSVHGRTARWWVSSQTTLTLSCGHKKTFGGDGGPSHKARCKECPDVGVEPTHAQDEGNSSGRQAPPDLRAQPDQH